MCPDVGLGFKLGADKVLGFGVGPGDTNIP